MGRRANGCISMRTKEIENGNWHLKTLEEITRVVEVENILVSMVWVELGCICCSTVSSSDGDFMSCSLS